MRSSNLTGKSIKNAKELAIYDHPLQYDSFITFDDFDILASDSYLSNGAIQFWIEQQNFCAKSFWSGINA